MNQVIVIFDKREDDNDKQWLENELSKITDYKVSFIHPDLDIPSLWIEKRKLKAYKEIVKVIKKANKIVKEYSANSIVVCWSIMTGMLSKFLINKKAIIISLNWLTPDKRFLNTFVRKKCIRDKRFYLFADQIGTMNEIIQQYGIKDRNKIGYFPDTFSDEGETINITSKIVEERRKNKICFTGGLNNRNWGLLYLVAKSLPNIHFIAVGCPKDFNKENLNNLESYNRLDSTKYYSLMKKAYLIYLPLCDERAAGAINMYRASKNHQVCLVTHAPSTEPYFPLRFNNNLIRSSDLSINISLIKNKFDLKNDEYIEEVTQIREYLETTFSPRKIAGILIQKIKELMP